MLQSVANIAYLKKRRAQGFSPALLTPEDQDVFQLLADLTEDFTEMDLLTADDSFEQLLNSLIVGMKAVAGRKLVDQGQKKSTKSTQLNT